MKLRPMKTARRLTLKSDAFEIFALTSLVTMSVVFLASLGVASSSPFAVLVFQIAILLAIYVIIRRCARRESLVILATVKDRILNARAATKG